MDGDEDGGAGTATIVLAVLLALVVLAGIGVALFVRAVDAVAVGTIRAPGTTK